MDGVCSFAFFFCLLGWFSLHSLIQKPLWPPHNNNNNNKLRPLGSFIILFYFLIVLNWYLSFVFYLLYFWLSALLALTLLIPPVYTILWRDHEFLRYVCFIIRYNVHNWFFFFFILNTDYQLCVGVVSASSMKKIPFMYSHLLAYYISHRALLIQLQYNFERSSCP